MACSMTVAASLVASPSKFVSQTRRPSVVIVASSSRVVAVKASSNVKASCENKQEETNNNNGRREMLLAVAAAAICSSAPALAQEPKRGTPQAKKAYAPVCVSNPTAKICNN